MTEERAKIAKQRRLDECPKQYLPLMGKVLAGDGTRSQCLKAMCLQCVGYERKAIRECKSWACPLWSLRPYQTLENKGGSEAEVDEDAGLVLS